MRTLETLFSVGYDLSQGSELYILYGFCLTARETKKGKTLFLDYLTESAGNPFTSLNIRLTEKQVGEIGEGADSPSFIRSNFTEEQQNEILRLGYTFANELKIDLEKERRKQLQAEEFFTLYPTCDVYECKPDYLPKDYKNAYLYPNEQDEYILVYPITRLHLNLETGKESYPLNVRTFKNSIPSELGFTLANGEKCIVIPSVSCSIVSPNAGGLEAISLISFTYEKESVTVEIENDGKTTQTVYPLSDFFNSEDESEILENILFY